MSSVQDTTTVRGLAAELERLGLAPRDCARRELRRLLDTFDPESFDGGFDIPAFVDSLTDAEVADIVAMLTADTSELEDEMADEFDYDNHDLKHVR